MCGIAGVARREPSGVTAETLLPMAAALQHRGPDGSRILPGKRVGLAHTRLSIIDLASGAQPMTSTQGRYTIVYNGEVYNYPELRRQLVDRGHEFRTSSDTEVVLQAYIEWGEQCLARFNGQFAIAIHDQFDDSVFLARDRFGVRPLFYSLQGDNLVFGSEVKALFASGEVDPQPDLEGLDEVLTCWAARAPRTVFRGVSALQPGWCARWQDGRFTSKSWFAPDFEENHAGASLLEEIDELLNQSVSYRMRADVTVGAYLSGGLDSSVTSTLASRMTPLGLRTFSIVFDDPAFNEAAFQQEVATSLGTTHHVRSIGAHDIASAFPQVVRHAETPLTRTAPAPMMLLAELTRQHNIKVVLTGEGADELFLGYDLFREASVRRFCLRGGNSPWRARLFDRLYPYMASNARGEMWQKWFLSAGDINDPLFSHMPRFLLSARTKDFYAPAARDQLGTVDPLDRLRDSLPAKFGSWSPANRAAFLEMNTLLEPYLLSSQGDRMSLAHGVEGRYPFLDHQLFAWTASLPTTAKLRGLSDKRVLRRWAARHLPANVANRPKQPYRAPDAAAFFGPGQPDYVKEMLEPATIDKAGYFDSRSVSALVRRCEAGRVQSARENQALVAILSTQLWHHTFFTGAQRPALRIPIEQHTERVKT